MSEAAGPKRPLTPPNPGTPVPDPVDLQEVRPDVRQDGGTQKHSQRPDKPNPNRQIVTSTKKK